MKILQSRLILSDYICFGILRWSYNRSCSIPPGRGGRVALPDHLQEWSSWSLGNNITYILHIGKYFKPPKIFQKGSYGRDTADVTDAPPSHTRYTPPLVASRYSESPVSDFEDGYSLYRDCLEQVRCRVKIYLLVDSPSLTVTSPGRLLPSRAGRRGLGSQLAVNLSGRPPPRPRDIAPPRRHRPQVANIHCLHVPLIFTQFPILTISKQKDSMSPPWFLSVSRHYAFVYENSFFLFTFIFIFSG